MNDIHNNENISQEEEFVSPGQEKVNGKATPEQSGPSTGEPREQPGEPTEEAVEIEETEEIEIIEAGEFTVPKKEEEEEEIQELHTKHPRRDVPVIDHRLLAGKLTVYDWLEDLPATDCAPEIVEVRFKNTRKGFYSNPSKLALKAGDIVAVEAALGHDIGVVSLSGELVKEQIRIKRVDLERNPLKKVYRKAKPHDIEKWQQAIALEHDTMIRSRKIAADLKLNMKIGDVEYQGDKTKAIFYRRRPGGFPDADQGVGGDFPYPYRNETDRDTSGSRQNRGYRSLRTQIMLFDFYHQFYFGVDLSRPLSGYFAESSEAGRTVRETEMLSEL